MGYIKNIALTLVLFGGGFMCLSYFGVINLGGSEIMPAGEIYGLEYGQIMQELKDINLEMEQTEARLKQLSDRREEVVARGGELISDSYERAHQDSNGQNTLAIEPMTGDISIGIYD